jgi:cell division septum initiation protein DivIVA
LDQALEDQLHEILSLIFDLEDKLSELKEEMNYRPREVEECHRAMEEISAKFQDCLQKVPADERDHVERRYGRAVIELRRDASWLPARSRGTPVAMATDESWLSVHRAAEKGDQSAKAPAHQPEAARPKASAGPSVGGEVEAWCGSCKGLRAHNIVAIVGDEPKQVLCRSCGARHGFRLSPARGKKDGPAKRKKGKLTAAEVESQRKEQERMAFFKELAEATEVREFSRKARYKAGQFIEHPDYGRGKIESVTRGSLLVRFRSGLKPVSTY